MFSPFNSAKFAHFKKPCLSSLIHKLIFFEEGLETSSKTGGQVLVDSVVLQYKGGEDLTILKRSIFWDRCLIK